MEASRLDCTERRGPQHRGMPPGSRYYASSWFDQNGDFWLYGGYGFDASSTSGYLDDLWEFNPSTKNWVWLAGSDASTCWSTEACPATAIYGTLGVPAATDTPGNRSGASSWTDKSGNFWLFGSNAWRLSGTTVTNNNLNDLWELNLSPQEWGWMSGSSVSNKTGTYGTLGMPAAGNPPEAVNLPAVGRMAAEIFGSLEAPALMRVALLDGSMIFGNISYLWRHSHRQQHRHFHR